MITQKEVKHVAKLARIGLTQKEVEKFRRELFSILDYVEKLKEVDISGIEPTSHPILIRNVMRSDEEKPKNRKTEKQKNLIDLAPEKKEGYLKTKPIL